MASCCICMEEIKEQCDGVELIECGHDCFHTQCIMQWFRTGFKRCPMCNDTGVAKEKPKRAGEEAVKLAKKEWRKGNGSAVVGKLISQLVKKEEALKSVKREIAALKAEEGLFRDLLKRQRKLWTRRWALQSKIIDLKRSIVQLFPVKELILVTKKEVSREKT